MAYALLTEGMSLEQRASFDQMLNAKPEPDKDPVVEQNREFARSLAAIGVKVNL